MCQQMKQAIVTTHEDSAHKMRTLTISGCIDYLGIAYATVTNELKQTYFTVIDIFGDFGECSCASTSVCYHQQALFSVVNQIPRYEEIEETTPVEEVMAVAQAEMEIHIEQVAAKAEKVSEQKMKNYWLERDDVYAQVGATKNLDMPSCWSCGRPGYYECRDCR